MWVIINRLGINKFDSALYKFYLFFVVSILFSVSSPLLAADNLSEDEVKELIAERANRGLKLDDLDPEANESEKDRKLRMGEWNYARRLGPVGLANRKLYYGIKGNNLPIVREALAAGAGERGGYASVLHSRYSSSFLFGGPFRHALEGGCDDEIMEALVLARKGEEGVILYRKYNKCNLLNSIDFYMDNPNVRFCETVRILINAESSPVERLKFDDPSTSFIGRITQRYLLACNFPVGKEFQEKMNTITRNYVGVLSILVELDYKNTVKGVFEKMKLADLDLKTTQDPLMLYLQQYPEQNKKLLELCEQVVKEKIPAQSAAVTQDEMQYFEVPSYLTPSAAVTQDEMQHFGVPSYLTPWVGVVSAVAIVALVFGGVWWKLPQNNR